MTWETVPLGELLIESHEVQGAGPALAPLTLTEGRGFLLQREKFKKRVALEDTSTYKVVRRGSIAFNPYLLWAGAIAQNNTWDAAVVSPAYPVFTPTGRADSRYLWHMLQSPLSRAQFDAISFGAIPRRRRASTVDFLRLTLPLPPLVEQRRIAAILDEADTLRRTRIQTFGLLDQVASSIFASHDRSDWRTTTVGDVADLQGGLTLNAKRAALPISAAYLRVANVFRGSIDSDEVKTLGVTDAELARTRLRLGDVLVVEGHGNAQEVGRAALVERLPPEPLTHQNHLFRLRPRAGQILGRFLELSINAPASREFLGRVTNTTSGLNTLNATNVRALPIRVPSVEVQRRIAEQQRHIREHAHSARQHAASLDALFASLQHRAFRGEL